MNKGLISVIVPVYNVEDLIVTCLDAIQEQTYKNFEIIIINDGSTDNTVNEINEMDISCKYRLINTENKGISAARNRGVDESVGEYITFIDSDDVVDPDYLEYLLSLSRKFNADIASCQHIVEFKNKKSINKSFKNPSHFMSAHDWIQDVLVMHKVDLSPWGKLYKSSLFDKHIFPEGLLFEDTYAIPVLVSETKGVAVGNEVKYHYKIREKSITRSKFKSSYLDLITSTEVMTEKILKEFPDLKREARVRKAWASVSVMSKILKSDNSRDYKELVNKIRSDLLGYSSSIIFYKKSNWELKIALILIFININLYNFFLSLRER
ncbi:glycosyltransferase family A protein [Pediococcus sp. AC40]|uniref:glycosyltransferase family 2 protein n=1 Tax=Pediococcus sp. AC40 TaxID=2962679 RepID=UPI00254A5181|nr:glycosyltransferase family A protein [Pediococcus sp. AC40]